MKISYVILVSFFFVLLLFSITTYINNKQAELVNDDAEKFAESTLIVRHSNRFQRNFLNMVSGLRGFALTNETFFIETYDSAILENDQILKALDELLADRTAQQATLNEIKRLNEFWIENVASPLIEAKKQTILSDSGRQAFNSLYQAAVKKGTEKTIQRNLQRHFSELTNYEYRFRDNQKEKLTGAMQQTKVITFSLTMISIITGMCIAIFSASYISSRIVKMVKMANQIAAGQYDVHMSETGNSELSQLAKALNDMARILDTNISLLKRQKEELDQFAHIVSHDLKAPLRGIDNVVTWIEEDHSFDLPVKVQEYLSIIKGRILRAESLLKGILQYAKVGREQRDKEIVDVNELLVEVKGYMPKQSAIELIVQPNLPVLYTERIPLLQIFTNLISNAYKYHDKPNGTVRVYHQTAAQYFEFFVSDDGPGIDKNHFQKIFQIFQTLHERDSHENTGVGLAIVKKILDDRNLKINVVSAPRQGTTFSFLWPKNEFDETSY
jgi:signal transduction histidine kinase